jgi:transposase-like protein
VVPLCPACHRAYDDERLSILEYLEPHWRTELAFAVERVGLMSALRRVTNSRWQPEERTAA